MLQGYRLTFFCQEQSWDPKTKWLGAQSKTKGPGSQQKIKLISTPLPSICFTHNWSQRPSKSVFLLLLTILGTNWMNICKLPDLTRLHTFTYYPFYRGKLGPSTFSLKGPAQNLGALGFWAPVSLCPCAICLTFVCVSTIVKTECDRLLLSFIPVAAVALFLLPRVIQPCK